MMTAEPRFIFKKTVETSMRQTVCDYLAAHTGLSKGKIKDAMNKGAVWLSKKSGKRRRLRRVTASPGKGDSVELHYDPALLAVKPPLARLVDDRGRYSVWFKPAGLMAQGTDYGDHCALLRQVELHFRPNRPVFLVHRLDREAAGLMLIAHDRQAAAQLSSQFQGDRIRKHYRARVRGAMEKRVGEIDLPLDGKRAMTCYEVVDYDTGADVTTLDITIETGRLHQIRRHFDMIGHPLLGDPKYGTGNKNSEGLQLIASGLRFRCPFSGREMDYSLNESFSGLL